MDTNFAEDTQESTLPLKDDSSLYSNNYLLFPNSMEHNVSSQYENHLYEVLVKQHVLDSIALQTKMMSLGNYDNSDDYQSGAIYWNGTEMAVRNLFEVITTKFSKCCFGKEPRILEWVNLEKKITANSLIIFKIIKTLTKETLEKLFETSLAINNWKDEFNFKDVFIFLIFSETPQFPNDNIQLVLKVRQDKPDYYFNKKVCYLGCLQENNLWWKMTGLRKFDSSGLVRLLVRNQELFDLNEDLMKKWNAAEEKIKDQHNALMMQVNWRKELEKKVPEQNERLDVKILEEQ